MCGTLGLAHPMKKGFVRELTEQVQLEVANPGLAHPMKKGVVRELTEQIQLEVANPLQYACGTPVRSSSVTV